jgi:hypothetical protein
VSRSDVGVGQRLSAAPVWHCRRRDAVQPWCAEPRWLDKAGPSTGSQHLLAVAADLHGPQFREEFRVDLPPVRFYFMGQSQFSQGTEAGGKKELARPLNVG